MKKLPIILILITIVLSACGAPAPAPTAVPPTAVPPTATPEPLCSDPTQVSFEAANNSDEEMIILWVNFDGVEENYGAVKPGEKFSTCTFEGHKWAVRKASGAFVTIYTANADATQSFDISQEMADNAGQEPQEAENAFRVVTDDTGNLKIEVPSDWLEQYTTPLGNYTATIIAAKNMEGFSNLQTEGVMVEIAKNTGVDAAGMMDTAKTSYSKSCKTDSSLPPRMDLKDEKLDGIVEMMVCEQSVIFLAVGQPKSNPDAYMAFVILNAPLDNDADLMLDYFNRIISSINFAE